MNTEETKDMETQEDVAPASTEETTPQEPSQSDEIDYKAELEKREKELNQAQFTIQKLKGKNKEEGAADEDKLKDLVFSTLQEFENKKGEQKLEEELNKIPEGERELIKFHLDNDIKRSGDVTRDLSLARALANRAKISKTNSELDFASKAKSNMQSVGGSPNASKNHEVSQDVLKYFTPEQLATMKERNIDPQEIYKKTIESRGPLS